MKDESKPLKHEGQLLRRLFGIGDLRAGCFILPLMLSAGAIFFEGATIGLLMPLLKGILEKDYNFLYDNRYFEALGQLFYFDRQNTPQKYLLAFLVAGVFFSAVFKNILQYVSMVAVDRIFFGFLHRLRVQIFNQLTRSGKNYFDRVNQGILLNTISVATLEIVVCIKALYRNFSTALLLIPYLSIMLFISWPLTLLSLIIAPFFTRGVSGVINRIREKSRIYTRIHSDWVAHTSNVLMNIGLVKAFRTEDIENKRFEQGSYQSAQSRFEVEKKQELVPAVHEMSALAALLVLMSAMAFMVHYKMEEDVSHLLVFFFTLKRSLTSFGAISHLRAHISRMTGPMIEIDGILSPGDAAFEKEGADNKFVFEKRIDFREVKFSYSNGTKALEGVTLSFEKGKCTALVGSSGAGKTSIISLLLKLYEPQSGEILIDGKDIRTLTLDALRKGFALVSQETFLFNDTIRNNVLYGTGRTVTDDVLAETLQKARLNKLVRDLPDGLETIIGDKGVRLSGGEKQRLAIARAILRQASVLIFDEATSSLDSITEKEIQEAIDEAAVGKTLILIAHRLSTIRKADKIIVLENGKVVEQGRFSDLIEKKANFYRYWKEQSSTMQGEL